VRSAKVICDQIGSIAPGLMKGGVVFKNAARGSISSYSGVQP